LLHTAIYCTHPGLDHISRATCFKLQLKVNQNDAGCCSYCQVWSWKLCVPQPVERLDTFHQQKSDKVSECAVVGHTSSDGCVSASQCCLSAHPLYPSTTPRCGVSRGWDTRAERQCALERTRRRRCKWRWCRRIACQRRQHRQHLEHLDRERLCGGGSRVGWLRDGRSSVRGRWNIRHGARGRNARPMEGKLTPEHPTPHRTKCLAACRTMQSAKAEVHTLPHLPPPLPTDTSAS
jgi:hypothetical protein